MDPERQVEQDFVDVAYARLDAMRSDANAMLDGVLDLGRGGTFQSRTERDVIVRTSLARLEQLDIGDQALTFGRIDRRRDGGRPGEGQEDRYADQPGSPANGSAASTEQDVETFHIGRLAVHGADHEPLVVDWRAPIAEPFYRATGRDPQGLVLRRHLALEGRRVTGIEDERFGGPLDDGAEPAAPDGSEADEGEGELIIGDLPIGGPAALLAALGRARSGRMTDIVSTIQKEQDEIIRAPLSGVLVVQGGPGTGKTAVALHRAAYLLYTHRFPLERQGVLVVGPNPLFLRYIEQVLPSLGETGVTLSTVSGLVPEIRVKENGPVEVARLKGDARMAKVIARAVRTRQRGLADPVAIPYGALILRLSAEESAAIVNTVRRRPGSHNARRRLVEQSVAQLLADRARQTQQRLGVGPPGSVTAFPGYEDPSELSEEEFDFEDFSRKVRRVPELVKALDRMWPRLSPHELLHDLFGARPLVAAAGRGILSREEQELLYRPRSASFEEVAWTPADAALVDEARHLLGPRQGGSDEAARQYGHIVVDEVQDLSPMQLRMLTRRSLSGSMTVVGDIAQATAPWSPGSWSDIMEHLPRRRPVRTIELSVSYRTPAEVLAVAGRVLAVAAPELVPPRPVRRTGVEPLMVAVAGAEGTRDGATVDDLVRTAAELAAEEVAAVAPGRVAVLAPETLLTTLSDALAASGQAVADARDPRFAGLSEPLVLLAADAANGLEFDSVVVVEPGLIAGETGQGLRTLYVALTRPTQRLTVVHLTPAPAALEAA
ncbi:MAG TPA: UvrD-helicase domain-containing protein [Acidimicrobiales bacterium]|nr:UvrD-helicase domain-containing protein [Acidimicrobiales bacterium]